MLKITIKMFALVLSVVLMLQTISFVTFAEEYSGSCGDDMTWVLSADGTLTIKGEGYMDSWAYHFGTPWYSYVDLIKNAIIEDGIKEISPYAFYNCVNLESVSVPDSVYWIGDEAFYNCSSLKCIDIPDGINIINDSAFYGCTSLESVNIPNGVVQISSNAFLGCSSLNNITIPDTVKDINVYAFFGCASLKGITMPDGIAEISTGVFSGCISLENVILPDSVETIGDYAFMNCTSLESIDIPDSVSTIYSHVFEGCTGLKSVNIPNGITQLYDSVFEGCSGLTEITLPESVTWICGSAFEGCTGLTEITVPESVTWIEFGAFRGCTNLEYVYLPLEMECIKSYAFYGCESLQSITIPADITTIEDNTFACCTNLGRVYIPASVTSISDSAFSNSDNVIIVGELGSAAEEYASEKGIPFEYFGGSSIALILRDSRGSEITEDYSVNWYNADGGFVASGDVLSGATAGADYIYEVVLGESLSNVYRQPLKGAATGSDAAQSLEITLEKHGTTSVNGTVTDVNNTPVNNAKITLIQRFNGGYEKSTVTYTDKDGAFAASVPDVNVTVVIEATGYGSIERVINAKNKDKIDLGVVQLNKLPANKVFLSLYKSSAVSDESASVMTLLVNFNGLSFSLYNKTQNRVIYGFTPQYPYLAIGDNYVNNGDVITISVLDTKGELTAASVDVVISVGETNTATLELVEHGRVEVASVNGNEKNTVMVFDADGTFVRSYIATSSFVSDGLPEGEYNFVFIKNTNLLRNVSNISKLVELGLEADEDYSVLNASVETGRVTAIEKVAVPALNEDKLYYTVRENTGFYSNNISGVVGRYVIFKCEYEIRPGHPSSSEKVIIEMPDDLSLANGYLTLNGKRTVFSVDDGKITVYTNEPSGVIRFYAIPLTFGMYNVSAYLSFTDADGAVQQPIGSVEYTALASKLTVPGVINDNSAVVSGTALPGNTVTVFADGTEVGSTTANSNGTWSLAVELDDLYEYTYHEIYAEIAIQSVSYRTDSEMLFYASSLPEVSELTVLYNGKTLSIDYDELQKPPSLTWSSDIKSYTFKVRFDSDSSVLNNVFVVAKNAFGDEAYIPVVYDSVSDIWLGVSYDVMVDDVPRSLRVVYDYSPDEDDITLDRSQIDDVLAGVETVNTEVDLALEEAVKDVAIDETLSMDEIALLAESDLDAVDRSLSLFEDDINGLYADAGITVSREEDATVISMTGLNTSITQSTCDGITAEWLAENGYESVQLSDGSLIYTKNAESTYSTADLANDIFVNVDLSEAESLSVLNYSLMSMRSGDSDMQAVVRKLEEAVSKAGNALDSLKACVEHLTGEIQVHLAGWESLILACETDMKRCDEYIRIYASKIEYYEAEGDVMAVLRGKRQLSDMQDMYSQLSIKRSIAINKFKAVKAFDDTVKVLNIVGLITTYADVFAHGQRLVDLYYSLPETCTGDSAALKAIKRDIYILAGSAATYYALTVTLTVGSLSGAFTAGATIPSAWVAVPVIVVGAVCSVVTFDYAMKQNYDLLLGRIKELKCDEPLPEGLPDRSGGYSSPEREVSVIIDPSGYVYEAVPSNRVEGVRAEAYYYDYPVDEFGEQIGEKTDIFWNAEDYDQVNPVYTDKDGRYAWDVPFGRWLVKFSKEGYYDTNSKGDAAADDEGYLPVPPPQTEVNIPIVSKSAPFVKAVNIYEDQVQIIFSQYMQIDSVNLSNVLVCADGDPIKGNLTAANAEYNYEKTAMYASVFVFTPETSLGDKVTVKVDNAVNYAGNKMQHSFELVKNAELRPQSIILNKEINIAHNSIGMLEIQLSPNGAGANKELSVVSSSEIVGLSSGSVVTDENGKATVALSGNLPGAADITVTLNGTDLSATVTAKVEIPETVSGACGKVSADITSGSIVPSGTELTLTSDTEGATIYYTIDGSCPCDTESKSRIEYTGPIVINEDVIIIAYAVKEGLEDSPTSGFVYSVSESEEWENIFTDVDGDDWHFEYVRYVAKNGLMNGTGKNIFSPNSSLTRAMLVTVLYRAEGEPTADAPGSFDDVVVGSYYEKAVIWAERNGIVNGVAPNKFAPDDHITREQIATIIYRYAQYKGYNLLFEKNALANFDDVSEISGYALNAMKYTVSVGLLKGKTKDTLNPRDKATRAETAAILQRFIEANK